MKLLFCYEPLEFAEHRSNRGRIPCLVRGEIAVPAQVDFGREQVFGLSGFLTCADLAEHIGQILALRMKRASRSRGAMSGNNGLHIPAGHLL